MPTENTTHDTHCVMIPFLNRLDQVATCLKALLLQAKPDTIFLLIDDGSNPQALHSMSLQPMLSLPNVHLIHHKKNCGVAATRNSGLHWCRNHHIDIAIMVDSDCSPEENVIDEHLRLHHEHPEATCIGGRILGSGMNSSTKNIWSKLDGITSWVHATPHKPRSQNAPAEFRRVDHPYHLATTNFSVKPSKLPEREFVFDERLKTGEDCLLIRELRRLRHASYFSETPTVLHQDRDNFQDVFKHHYEWGHHQYFIQLGGDLSSRCFHPLYRLFFCLWFSPLVPLFALAGSLFNVKPLLHNNRRGLFFYPLIYLLWFGKGIAVVEAAIRPQACLRKTRFHVEYEEALTFRK